MSFACRVMLQSAARRQRAVHFTRPALVLLAATWFVGLENLPFWRALWRAEGGLHPGNALFLLSAPVAALAWTHILLLVLAWGRATKFVLGSLLFVAAAASYFTQAYGVLFDSSMVANAVQTHAAEARDIVSWPLVAWMAGFGGVPAAFIIGARTSVESLVRELGRKSLHLLIAIACLMGVLMLNYQSYASTLRNHRHLRLMLVPHNVIAALHGYLGRQLAPSKALEQIGLDAQRIGGAGAMRKPMLAVLVVGETARSQNFSLNGYARLTNPELARQDVLSFTNVSACGTSTAVSLPCMFADVGRARYYDGLASHREGLLDVLQHAGITVLWRDNNSGCKGVCERVPHESASVTRKSAECRDGECHDGILLRGLQDYINELEGDTVIVLHMIGSHGPAYFKRYPPVDEAFSPACRTGELSRCSREMIINAYDNSIRHTDRVLADAIRLLRSNSERFDTAMLYISDHGESLGENGLYLHGIPYAFAPREQVHVPMVAWLSDGMYERLGLDRRCLAARQGEALSHDNFFHSVLGLAMVRTSMYDPERDLFVSCRH